MLPLLNLQPQVIVVGDALEVGVFGGVADVGIDVPAVALVRPDVTRDGGTFVHNDSIALPTNHRHDSRHRFTKCTKNC